MVNAWQTCVLGRAHNVTCVDYKKDIVTSGKLGKYLW